MKSFRELVLKNRSYRRFFETEKISKETLLELIDLSRLTPSAANKQPLKFYLSYEKETNEKIFPTLGFAGYLQDWKGPVEGEKPSAYVVILRDRDIPYPCEIDHGISAQTILLGAVEKGLGGCIFAAIDKKKLKENLNLPEVYDILLVLALGKPKEMVKLETVNESGDIRYYRDEDQTHHVPKRALNHIILNFDK